MKENCINYNFKMLAFKMYSRLMSNIEYLLPLRLNYVHKPAGMSSAYPVFSICFLPTRKVGSIQCFWVENSIPKEAPWFELAGQSYVFEASSFWRVFYFS